VIVDEVIDPFNLRTGMANGVVRNVVMQEETPEDRNEKVTKEGDSGGSYMDILRKFLFTHLGMHINDDGTYYAIVLPHKSIIQKYFHYFFGGEATPVQYQSGSVDLVKLSCAPPAEGVELCNLKRSGKIENFELIDYSHEELEELCPDFV
jgi:hypothetical protein